MALIVRDDAGSPGDGKGIASTIPVFNSAPTDADFTQGTVTDGLLILVDDGDGTGDLYARLSGSWVQLTDATA